MTREVRDEELRKAIREILDEELRAILEDVSWRMRQLYEHSERVPAEGLNLKQHLLTGYLIEDNKPTAGSIRWTDLHVVYQGEDFGPFSGSTDKKYTWFDYDHASNKIQSSDTKPTLQPEDALLFINDNGIATVVPGNSMTHGATIKNLTVGAGELANNAVTGGKIANLAVSGQKIAAGAVDGTKLAESAVGTAHLQDGAVLAAKLASGAVSAPKLNLISHLLY